LSSLPGPKANVVLRRKSPGNKVSYWPKKAVRERFQVTSQKNIRMVRRGFGGKGFGDVLFSA